MKKSRSRKMNLSATQYDKLGKVPDSVLADEVGVSVQTIFAERSSHKISACRKHTVIYYKKLTEEQHSSLVKELGTKRDSILSRIYGVSREYVRQLRIKHSIPKFSPQTIYIAN